MIEKISENIYRFPIRYLTKNKHLVFQRLSKMLNRDFSYMICQKKEDGKINGMWEKVSEIKNDYSKHIIIIIK